MTDWPIGHSVDIRLIIWLTTFKSISRLLTSLSSGENARPSTEHSGIANTREIETRGFGTHAEGAAWTWSKNVWKWRLGPQTTIESHEWASTKLCCIATWNITHICSSKVSRVEFSFTRFDNLSSLSSSLLFPDFSNFSLLAQPRTPPSLHYVSPPE